jgi:mono/diheme cytochrome c family protein
LPYYVVQFKLGDQGTPVDNTVHTTPFTTTGALTTWDTTQYKTAAFDLRLLVADKSGQFVTSTVSIKVDNTNTPQAVVLPNRGCASCHTQIAPDGRYTIAWEAMQADAKHPALPKGFQTTYQDCMLCHASKGTTGIAGTVAPLAMRAILHPAHMTSEIFTGELHGTCFSCHEVDNGGEFQVLPDKVKVNEHGVQTNP